MNEKYNEIADWLRDAHAMESNLVNMLDGQIEKLADYPDLQAGVSAHAKESKMHAQLVESALDAMGEDTSALKEGVAKLSGKLSPLGIGMASDAPVKIVLSNYAAEHFEIACYRSLAAAAEACGLPEVASICRRILEDEERMAAVLEPAITQVTTRHMTQVNRDNY